jgi:Fur family ferric uptake transcriptional regulator
VVETARDWQEHTVAAIRRAGYRAGGARTAVVELLGRQDCCLSAQEIFDALRADTRSVGMASVYRVLEQLSSMELVQRIEIGDGITRYEPAHPGGEHHHHLICTGCSRVLAFEDPPLEQALDGLSDRLGQQVAMHDVVLRGVCADCAPHAAGSKARV